MRFALVLVLVACSSKGPVDPSQTPAGPKPCEKMADHMVQLMTADKAGEKPSDSLRDAKDKLTRLLIERCTKDKWTLDAQHCFEALPSLDKLDSCAPLLTVEQRDALPAAIDAAFPKQPGSGG